MEDGEVLPEGIVSVAVPKAQCPGAVREAGGGRHRTRNSGTATAHPGQEQKRAGELANHPREDNNQEDGTPPPREGQRKERGKEESTETETHLPLRRRSRVVVVGGPSSKRKAGGVMASAVVRGGAEQGRREAARVPRAVAVVLWEVGPIVAAVVAAYPEGGIQEVAPPPLPGLLLSRAR